MDVGTGSVGREIPSRVEAALAASFVRPPAASARVADALRQQIVEGGLAPGSQLVEESLVRTLGVSRNTVREAFALLSGERIVERIPNRGVFVAQPDLDTVRDLYATRALIEPAALRWGVPPTEQALTGLRQAVSDGRAARARGEWPAVAMANQRFHRQLVELGGSRRVTAAFASALAEMRLVFHAAGNGSFHGDYVDQNDEIVTRLEAGRREDAADYLAGYLVRARDDLLERLASSVN